jgi:hypothetical protein
VRSYGFLKTCNIIFNCVGCWGWVPVFVFYVKLFYIVIVVRESIVLLEIMSCPDGICHFTDGVVNVV